MRIKNNHGSSVEVLVQQSFLRMFECWMPNKSSGIWNRGTYVEPLEDGTSFLETEGRAYSINFLNFR